MASLLHHLRNTPRAIEVIEVLARHGFASFISRIGLDHYIERGRELIGLPVAEEAAVKMHPAERLRHVLEDLGPTFIKLGQILSTRPDLITSRFAAEFRKLQAATPSAPFDQIRQRLVDDFGPDLTRLFRTIDEQALASASIAQTHRAILADGTPVILKIIRPGVEEIVEADMRVLTDLAALIESTVQDFGFSPSDLVREFARQIRRELDLQIEGRSIERLRAAFDDDPRIHFTEVYWQATSRHVLAIEEVKGTLLSKLNPASLSAEERLAIVEAGTDAVFRMCLEHGFFHADPHPGNIFACPGGELYFIDCGMTGYIEQRNQARLASLVAAVIASDLDRVVRSLIELADADPSMENDRAFRADTWEIVTRFHGGALENLNVAALLNSFFDMLQRHRIHLPADMAILIKALTTIQGVGEAIAPEFDLVSHVRPMIEALVRRQYGPQAMKDRTQRSLAEYLALAEELPREIRLLAAELRRKKFQLRLQMDEIHELKQGLVGTGRLLALAMVMASIVIGASNMAQIEGGGWLLNLLGLAALTGAFLFCVWVALLRDP